jgi:hypothetical protein
MCKKVLIFPKFSHNSFSQLVRYIYSKLFIVTEWKIGASSKASLQLGERANLPEAAIELAVEDRFVPNNIARNIKIRSGSTFFTL